MRLEPGPIDSGEPILEVTSDELVPAFRSRVSLKGAATETAKESLRFLRLEAGRK